MENLQTIEKLNSLSSAFRDVENNIKSIQEKQEELELQTRKLQLRLAKAQAKKTDLYTKNKALLQKTSEEDLLDYPVLYKLHKKETTPQIRSGGGKMGRGKRGF